MKKGTVQGPLLPFRNLVIITLDCVRPDFLGCYGSQHVRTPTLNRLASKGVVCDQVITQAPNTWVAHAGLFTGLYPPLHGLRSPYDRLDPELPTLASILAEQGFRSAAFPGNDLVGSRMGFQKGFDFFFEDYQLFETADAAPEALNANNRNKWEDVLKAAEEWLAGTTTPVFLWFHYLDTHHLPECDLPEYYRFSQDPLWQFYEGKISYADERCIRSILELLSRQGRYEDSLLVILSDHGETLLPGRPPFHNSDLSEAVIRVPLILFSEQIPWKGLRLPSLVRTVDLVPTLLNLRGDRAPASMDRQPAAFSGRRLPLPGRDEAGKTRKDKEIAYAENEPMGSFCLRTEEWKYHATPVENMLFHLSADPQERHNVIDRHPSTAEYLKKELDTIRACRPREKRISADREEQETRRLLQAFGYIE